jgi:hypothetical protein
LDEKPHIWGMRKNIGCTWLKRVFYSNQEIIDCSHDKSLTLSDLKKDEVLKIA